MSKYDFEIDLSLNSSTGIILSKISEGSTVLEFGCATGRMTRYMKETLGCKVYIVEYEQEAYDIARKYAEDGLCDDIMAFRWVEQFSDIKFDSILFADVLEHLSAPEKVLEQAAALLKDEGSIHISIPNITHNDILLKAIDERFDYTKTGLLDDTHIHFWGFQNLPELANRCGLTLRCVEATHCPTGLTEQYAQQERTERPLLESILKARTCGEVYQFVITLDKHNGGEVSYRFNPREIESHIYLDTGNDFNENEQIKVMAEYTGEGSFMFHYTIENTGEVKRIRFDPIEGQECILRSISICQDGQPLSLVCVNSIAGKHGLFLQGTDPFVYADTLSTNGPITIDADIILLGEQFLNIIRTSYTDQHLELEHVQGELHQLHVANEDLQNKAHALAKEQDILRAESAALTSERDALRAESATLTSERDGLREKIAVLNDERDVLCEKNMALAEERDALQKEAEALTAAKQKLEKEFHYLSAQAEELRVDIGSYIMLVNNKDKYALELEANITTLESELNRYKSMKIIRLYLFVRRIAGKCKRLAKRVLKKAYKVVFQK